MKSIFYLLLMLFSCTESFAFFCPTNFNQINIGDTLEEVIKQCGKPNKQKEVTTPNENVVQEWGYYNNAPVSPEPTNPPVATLKTNITFDKDGKAISISVNGIGVGATSICGPLIQIGNTRDQVEAACGKPVFLNKQNTPGDTTPKEIKTTQVLYETDPPLTLIFEDGKLKERK